MSDTVFQNAPELHISQSDASDPAAYRRAKAQADAAGQRLVIDRADAEPMRPAADAIVIAPGTDPATYRKLKAQAEQSGKPLVFVDRSGNAL